MTGQLMLLGSPTVDDDVARASKMLAKIAANPTRADLVSLAALADTFRRAGLPSKAEHAEELARVVRG